MDMESRCCPKGRCTQARWRRDGARARARFGHGKAQFTLVGGAVGSNTELAGSCLQVREYLFGHIVINLVIGDRARARFGRGKARFTWVGGVAGSNTELVGSCLQVGQCIYVIVCIFV